ncbi:MAG: phosphatase PAP2 family protein [Bacilli bacterium]|nr:phosphatase PAP2 family protein [Bacilli bacterium]
MKKRYHLFIVMGVLIIGLILGSFFDLQINQAIFVKDNWFGLWMASFGVYPCYMGLAFAGGALLLVGTKRKELPIWGKILSYFFSVLAFGMSIYLCGKEFPSPNGYNVPHLAWLGYLLAGIFMAGSFALGFFLLRKGDLKMITRMCILILVIFTIALLPPGFLIKLVIHRPRYRYAVRSGLTAYYNWWEMFPEYKNYISTAENPIFVEGFEITKEEFKSFPSGHSGTGAIMMMFLPYFAMVFKKLRGKETLLFYIGFVWALIMMFSRMLVGAHYLTDTCMGSLFVVVVYYVVNEFALHKKLFDDPVEEIQPEAAPQE